nr:OmpA family protein [uncultured Ottowia sp.]
MTSSPSPCAARLLAAACAAAVLAGCANVTEGQRNVMIGTGVGAAAGGLIGDGRGAAIGAAVGALGTYAWTQYMENKRRDMERVTAGTGVRVEQTADNQLKLSVPSDISFATNSAQIVSGLRPVLDTFANGLSQQPGLEIVIVGHADSSGNDAINDPLARNRAASVRDYLVSRGVSSARIQTEGRGSREPIASNATAEGRARNRRVEIFLAERAQQQPAYQQPTHQQPAYQQQPSYSTPVGTPMN